MNFLLWQNFIAVWYYKLTNFIDFVYKIKKVLCKFYQADPINLSVQIHTQKLTKKDSVSPVGASVTLYPSLTITFYKIKR